MSLCLYVFPKMPEMSKTFCIFYWCNRYKVYLIPSLRAGHPGSIGLALWSLLHSNFWWRKAATALQYWNWAVLLDDNPMWIQGSCIVYITTYVFVSLFWVLALFISIPLQHNASEYQQPWQHSSDCFFILLFLQDNCFNCSNTYVTCDLIWFHSLMPRQSWQHCRTNFVQDSFVCDSIWVCIVWCLDNLDNIHLMFADLAVPAEWIQHHQYHL